MAWARRWQKTTTSSATPTTAGAPTASETAPTSPTGPSGSRAPGAGSISRPSIEKTSSTAKEFKHGGAASLRIQYDLAPESWAACSLVHDQPRDWSGSDGLSFHLHAEKAGEPINVIAYGGKSPDDLLNFECTFRTTHTAVDGWQRIDLAWSQLRLPEWQGDSSQKYDPRQAMGVGFAFHSPGQRRRAGKVWIDDVSLLLPEKQH